MRGLVVRAHTEHDCAASVADTDLDHVADGNVARAMYGVNPEGNADEVLEALPG